jgi:5'(3')-deoxyribonucleotidase
MRILIDLDNTINQLSEAFIKEVLSLGCEFDYFNYKDYNISTAIKASPRVQNDVLHYVFSHEKFWDTIQPREDATIVLSTLFELHDCYICTTPWKDTFLFKNWRLNWLHKHFPFIEDTCVLFENEKWKLLADIIIEDKPETLERCYPHMITIKIDQPYNTNVKADYTLYTWTNIFSILYDIENKEIL